MKTFEFNHHDHTITAELDNGLLTGLYIYDFFGTGKLELKQTPEILEAFKREYMAMKEII